MTSGFLDRDDVRLWYEELGRPEGAPVLLVMGGGGSVVWWPPELIQGLVGAGYRVIQFDNRDVGLSTHVDAATAMYGIDAMAGDAMAVLDVVGIDGAHLVGVSMGGMVCLAAALLHPHRVRSLALISSTPGPDPRLPKGDEGHPEGDAGPLGWRRSRTTSPTPPRPDPMAHGAHHLCAVMSHARDSNHTPPPVSCAVIKARSRSRARSHGSPLARRQERQPSARSRPSGRQ